jgi:hypothetical protein
MTQGILASRINHPCSDPIPVTFSVFTLVRQHIVIYSSSVPPRVSHLPSHLSIFTSTLAPGLWAKEFGPVTDLNLAR